MNKPSSCSNGYKQSLLMTEYITQCMGKWILCSEFFLKYFIWQDALLPGQSNCTSVRRKKSFIENKSRAQKK